MTTSIVAQSASAQVFWDGGGGDNNWSNPANWSTTGFDDAEPTISDFALLNNGGTINVTQTGERAARFQMGRGNYVPPNGANPNNLGIGGTVNIEAGGELVDAGAFDLGVFTAGSTPQTPSQTNILNVNGGNLITGEFLRVAPGAGTTAVVNLNSGLIDVSTQDTAGTDTTYIGDTGNGTFNMTGGTFRVRRQIVVGLNSSAVGHFNVSGGTIDARGDFVIGNNAVPTAGTPNGFFSHTGGAITVLERYTLGFNPDSLGTSTESGGTVVAAQFDVGRAGNGVMTLNGNASFTSNSMTTIARATGSVASTGTLNIAGTASLTTGGLGVGYQGNGVLNLNSGTVTVTGVTANGGYVESNGDASILNLLVGRDGGGAVATGNGVVNHAGGTMTVATDMFLGDFDDSLGTYNISGGTLAVAGNVHIGGALASNAPSDATRVGTQGQATGAKGRFHVVGNAATITVGGNFLANPADRTRTDTANQATLAFDIDSAAGTSLINVTGVADLDGAVVDMTLLGTTYVPAYQSAFTLLSAATFGATGAGTTQATGTGTGFALDSSDAADWALSIISSGGRQSLVATNLVVPGDTNNDKKVDFSDLLALAKNYGGTSGETRTTGDFNRSGGTDFTDLLILAKNYGFGASAAASFDTSSLSPQMASEWALAKSLVPEPTSLTVLAGAGLLLRRRRTAVQA